MPITQMGAIQPPRRYEPGAAAARMQTAVQQILQNSQFGQQLKQSQNQFDTQMGELARQYDLTDERQKDEFTRTLTESQRQHNETTAEATRIANRNAHYEAMGGRKGLLQLGTIVNRGGPTYNAMLGGDEGAMEAYESAVYALGELARLSGQDPAKALESLAGSTTPDQMMQNYIAWGPMPDEAQPPSGGGGGGVQPASPGTQDPGGRGYSLGIPAQGGGTQPASPGKRPYTLGIPAQQGTPPVVKGYQRAFGEGANVNNLLGGGTPQGAGGIRSYPGEGLTGKDMEDFFRNMFNAEVNESAGQIGPSDEALQAGKIAGAQQAREQASFEQSREDVAEQLGVTPEALRAEEGNIQTVSDDEMFRAQRQNRPDSAVQEEWDKAKGLPEGNVFREKLKAYMEERGLDVSEVGGIGAFQVGDQVSGALQRLRDSMEADSQTARQGGRSPRDLNERETQIEVSEGLLVGDTELWERLPEREQNSYVNAMNEPAQNFFTQRQAAFNTLYEERKNSANGSDVDLAYQMNPEGMEFWQQNKRDLSDAAYKESLSDINRAQVAQAEFMAKIDALSQDNPMFGVYKGILETGAKIAIEVSKGEPMDEKTYAEFASQNPAYSLYNQFIALITGANGEEIIGGKWNPFKANERIGDKFNITSEEATQFLQLLAGIIGMQMGGAQGVAVTGEAPQTQQNVDTFLGTWN